MALNGIFDIAGMGMSAQSVRLNTIASNIANAQTAASSTGEAYRARHPVFSAVQRDAFNNQGDPFAVSMEDSDVNVGVRVAGIVESTDPLERRFEPDHPQADEEGYVTYSNVNVVEEMADMISASRGFQINVEVMQSAKGMAQRLLSLGQ